jgi:hypothetical protein
MQSSSFNSSSKVHPDQTNRLQPNEYTPGVIHPYNTGLPESLDVKTSSTKSSSAWKQPLATHSTIKSTQWNINDINDFDFKNQDDNSDCGEEEGEEIKAESVGMIRVRGNKAAGSDRRSLSGSRSVLITK